MQLCSNQRHDNTHRNMMDYPPRKSQTIPPYLLQNHAEQLMGLSKTLNRIDETTTDAEEPFEKSYRRLPRVIPLESNVAPKLSRTSHVDEHLLRNNVIIVSGEKLQPGIWKIGDMKHRRHRSRRRRDKQQDYFVTRDQASSPIRTLEHDNTNYTNNINNTNTNNTITESETIIDTSHKNLHNHGNSNIKSTFLTISKFPTENNLLKMSSQRKYSFLNFTPSYMKLKRVTQSYSDPGGAPLSHANGTSAKPAKSDASPKSIASVQLNTSEDDQGSLFTPTPSVEISTASNPSSATQIIQATTTKPELTSDVSVLEFKSQATREIAVDPKATTPAEQTANVSFEQDAPTPVNMSNASNVSSPVPNIEEITPTVVPKLNAENEKLEELTPINGEKSPMESSNTFSIFLPGSPILQTYKVPEDSHTVTTSLRVHRIYPKPPRLRREQVESQSIQVCRMASTTVSNPVRSSPPSIPAPDVVLTERFLLTQPMNNYELPENKAVTLTAKFGQLNSHIESVTFRLHDYSVIPGGPLRGIIYLVIRQSLIVWSIELKIEELLKFTSAKGKRDFEKWQEYTHTCLTSNSDGDRREPPQKFHYDLIEFNQSATAPVKLTESCYLPYCGPVEFKQGHYAIPCIFPVNSKCHPSFVLKQNTATPNALELVHSYCIYASLQCSKEQKDTPEKIDTGRLPIKVMSCGPFPPELNNGESIPAVIQTFALPDVNLMIQAESLTVQDGDAIRFYLFADKLGVIKHVRAYLLQIFHIPSMNIDDQKALYKVKKFPDNVVVRDQTEAIPLTADFVMPFSPRAEAMSQQQMGQAEQSGEQHYRFHVSSVSGEDQVSTDTSLADSVVDVPWDQRKAGCVVNVTVPTRSLPQIQMDDVRVSYYVRLLIHLKKKVTAYSIPITVVETRVRDYKMEYLGDSHQLRDKAYLRLDPATRCPIS